jgi:hypothetical protein
MFLLSIQEEVVGEAVVLVEVQVVNRLNGLLEVVGKVVKIRRGFRCVGKLQRLPSLVG